MILPARGRPRVLGRPPRRPVLHPHQQGRPTNFKVVTCPVDKTDPAGLEGPRRRTTRRCCVEGVDAVQGLRRRLRAARRAAAPARRSTSRPASRTASSSRSRSTPLALGGNPEFDTDGVRLTLHVAGHARRRCTSTTWRPRSRKLLKRTEVPGGYDPDEYADRADLRHRRGRDEGADLARLQEGAEARRHGRRACCTATAPTGRPMPVGFDPTRLQPAGPRRGLRPGPHPRRQRPGPRRGTTTARC